MQIGCHLGAAKSWSWVFENLYKCYQKGMKSAFIILAITYTFWGQNAQNVYLTLIQILETMLTTFPKIFWVYLHFTHSDKKSGKFVKKHWFLFIVTVFYNHLKYKKWHYKYKDEFSINSLAYLSIRIMLEDWFELWFNPKLNVMNYETNFLELPVSQCHTYF